MLRFFRQLRQRLLTDNKFSKYLLYAIGEVLLVVIGILIALQVNNWNEQRKNEEKIRIILLDIMSELASDIEKSRIPMKYYSPKDSLIFLVLNDGLTKKDYEQNMDLLELTKTYSRYSPTNNAYLILKENLDVVPPKYKIILNELMNLYGPVYDQVQLTNRFMVEFIANAYNEKSANYPWYMSTIRLSTSNRLENQNSQIEFMFSDFRYKNEVANYWDHIMRQLMLVRAYRKYAINCYIKIAQLLNVSVYDNSFVFDPETSNILIGDWKVIEEPERIYTFFEVDKRLYLKNNEGNVQQEVYLIATNGSKRIFSDNMLFGSLIKEGNQYYIRYNTFNLKKSD